MKKPLLWLLIMLLTVSMIATFSLAGCKKEAVEKEVVEEVSEEEVVEEAAPVEEVAAELKKLRVAVMPFFLSAPVNYIVEQGWDKEAGLDVDTILFSSGATMNEALGAKLWDVAPTGGAAVFGVAAFGATFIGDFIDGTGGNEIYVRGDSDIAKIKGFNPTFPDLLGDPDTVKGKTFMYTAGTTSQMAMVKYLEAIGVAEEDVEKVHLEFPQVYQGFLAGEGDLAAMVSPFVFMAQEQGWVKAASLRSLGALLLETVIAAPDAYANMKDELAIFLNLLYRANEEFENNPDLKFNAVKDWYVLNGAEDTKDLDERVQLECDLKSFLTKADVENIEYGKYQREYAEFLVSIDKLTPEQVDIVVDNTKVDILDRMKALE